VAERQQPAPERIEEAIAGRLPGLRAVDAGGEGVVGDLLEQLVGFGAGGLSFGVGHNGQPTKKWRCGTANSWNVSGTFVSLAAGPGTGSRVKERIHLLPDGGWL